MPECITDFALQVIDEEYMHLCEDGLADWLDRFLTPENPDGSKRELLDEESCYEKIQEWFKEYLQEYEIVSQKFLLDCVVDSIDCERIYKVLQKLFIEYQQNCDESD